MYLLLSESTDTARAVVAEAFLKDHPNWKHLALEDIEEDGQDDDILNMQRTFMTMVACQCAKDEREGGHCILITCPSPEMVADVRGEISEGVVCVHLGNAKGGDFDYVLDTRGKSVGQTIQALNDITQLAA